MENKKVRWGILSTAKIAVKNVIPSMKKCKNAEITAISSRSLDKAAEAARRLDIPKSYGSYEQLLADPEIDAVYNPLPNHLHVPYTLKAMEAGKHVLCEKPIAVTAEEAEKLLDAAHKYPKLKVMEAFMYRFHPQWEKVKELLRSKRIGELRYVHSVFTYYNVDPDNVRNHKEYGGGGVLDIGCYSINLSRFLFGEEPENVSAYVERDPDFGVDRLANGTLKFPSGLATFTCSTQLHHRQTAVIYGTKGTLELNIPFNAANEQLRKIRIQTEQEEETLIIDKCDQYTLQGDAFSKAILGEAPVPLPLEDALANMKVIDQVLNN